MIPIEWLYQARERINPFITRTPITFDNKLGIYLKWENHQVTGSFKARGAFNKALSLQSWERELGLVAASAGNHGQGVALAGKNLGIPVTIFCSENAVPVKIKAMGSLGAKLHLVHGGYGEAEQAGLEYSKQSGGIWISPYNDGQVIAGQATIGFEILEDLPELDHATWLIPASGGGLISGIGVSLTQQISQTKLVGVQAQASPFLHNLYFRGTQEGVQDLPTLADGLTGPVEEGSLTVPIIKHLVDDFILVSEDEIGYAINYAWDKYQEKIEGSAAVALAPVLSGQISSRPVVVIVSGGNIQNETFQAILTRYR
jgi:threonine dehydratase